ncbi:RidA family protein [Nocardia donostiensis]|uniref:YjgF translation initiation inhibitor n=1 Tax=Nocardia donostiensis TaxID=1538463 RepID=A0A1W0BAS9_9NOCA|nr:RidA family protein [Nocardia donostiensis]ONM46741.1 YjgF translation initiation inhibitor [Nocardia donostiensis]OQS16215.1 YjgF translation initiation inhibitor [Nocardia donostiensis]OQS19639.1 YjgF translation initiation inhibitor [Nocardia donostiensis]
MTDIQERLAALAIELPVLGAPRYAYEASVRWENMLWVSGQISRTASGEILRGCVGDTVAVAEGISAAETCALNLLARINEAVGLENVAQVLKLNIWVASSPDFVDQPTVADGASRLLHTVLGDAGRHARTALPSHVLPQGALVELDATIAVRG